MYFLVISQRFRKMLAKRISLPHENITYYYRTTYVNFQLWTDKP